MICEFLLKYAKSYCHSLSTEAEADGNMRKTGSQDIAGNQARQWLTELLAARLQPVVAPPSERGAKLMPGHHAHDSWECFWIYGNRLRFEVAGHAPMTVPRGTLLLIPPDCVHMQMENNNTARALSVLVISLPGHEVPNGGLGCATVDGAGDELRLSAEASAAWSAMLGEPPGTVMTRAVAALNRGGANTPFGAALVRLVLSAMGVAASMAGEPSSGQAERRVIRAQAILRERFYDPALSLEMVANEVGLSPTRLAARFKETTGQPLWQTLIGIRLDRAKSLLEGGLYSIKEIAALTGWSNQLYFSSAFRRRYGQPPTAIRAARSR